MTERTVERVIAAANRPAAAATLTGTPVSDMSEYIAAGGGQALSIALDGWPRAVIEEIERSGLRGRGGAGFPTGIKWASVAAAQARVRHFVCNAAEGEPGTFKDRWLLRRNPYQVLEGLAIGAHAIGAERAYVVVNRSFAPELQAVRRALGEMRAAGTLGVIPVEVVTGPDEYLLGEEKAMLEVIEGNDPLPRILAPYRVGLFARPGSDNPAVVNNVETLANVPHIIRRGAEWFRALGTDASPGTMVFTLCGDVRRPGIYELPLGVPFRTLLEDLGGGPLPGRRTKAVFPGVSGGVLFPELFDTPLDFDAMRDVGSALGSGGFAVYDESACIVAAVLALSRFLHVESCAQCPACKQGAGDITEALQRIEDGAGSWSDVRLAVSRSSSVTGGQRCGLPTGESLLVTTAIHAFEAEFKAHLGRPCPTARALPVPKLVDFDERSRRFTYDAALAQKLPDWTVGAGSRAATHPTSAEGLLA